MEKYTEKEKEEFRQDRIFGFFELLIVVGIFLVLLHYGFPGLVYMVFGGVIVTFLLRIVGVE